jgi:hypothetical protein
VVIVYSLLIRKPLAAVVVVGAHFAIGQGLRTRLLAERAGGAGGVGVAPHEQRADTSVAPVFLALETPKNTGETVSLKHEKTGKTPASETLKQ